MNECTEIKLNDKFGVWQSVLFLKKNERGIDLELSQSIIELREKFKNTPWLKIFDFPETKYEKRLVEFAESRRCLIAAFKKLSENNSLNEKTPIHLSLSHTSTHSVALATLDNQKRFSGVGVDIELRDREIKASVRAKFIFKSEAIFHLKPLEIWTIKEASFKANSNLAGIPLFQYEIIEYDPLQSEGKTVVAESPSRKTTFKMCLLDNLLITAAFALKKART